MIEETVIGFLADQLGIPVYAEVPADAPLRYVTVEKTGGGRRNQISSAVLAIQSHAETKFLAAQLNQLVKEKMERILELDEIAGCHLNSDYDFTDTARKLYRYQAVYDVTHYE